ncbi:DUF2235 domain-containing protein [Chishuiella sp.]|uniref:T6SS phospholipase effector Tle1-like catalytic domain-containing protein n=1 Tax=Chishuiella sp. TaxID=1969467 RepID=UPI0028AFF2AD|nr:DUF2235 domain-containing protein [Chishuiella sp.]
MNKKLHLTLLSYQEGLSGNVLTIPKSSFSASEFSSQEKVKIVVTIKEYQDEINQLKNNGIHYSDIEFALQQKKIFDKYKDVHWVWSTAPTTFSSKSSYTHNSSKSFGLDEGGTKTFYLSPLFFGGGLVYIEAFHPDEKPNGDTGIYIKALQEPTVIRTEWTDYNYNPLTNDDTVKYGSVVLLHIYTKDLYGQKIEVKLYNKENQSKLLNISDRWSFIRKVKIIEASPFEVGEKCISGELIDDEVTKTFVQKVVIEVKIDDYWETLVRTFLGNTDLDLYVKVYQNEEKLPIAKIGTFPFLKVRTKGIVYDDDNDASKITNNPVLVEDQENESSKNPEDKVNFTFGVFLDGTLNNMYNAELRQFIEEKRQEKLNPFYNSNRKKVAKTGLALTYGEAEVVYKKLSKEKVYKNPEEGEASYENDLSNPARLFKSYKNSRTNKIFKVYTEGIGSHTAPVEQGADLRAEDYKKDDTIQGPAFGMGNAGIKDKVRKSIDDIVKYISKNLQDDEYLGTITFDVFGFSRGAAAACHFVHVVKHSSYLPKTMDSKLGRYVEDAFGHEIGIKYGKQLMPEYGYLGMLLQEMDLLNIHTKVNVRFVGIYDTVPHHGLFQDNDIEDLGLKNVNKANYVVHMVADDEHRMNFSLVKISSVNKTSPDSGIKGGLEISYPGVHSDVGGSYVEGWGNNPTRIDDNLGGEQISLEPLRRELIHQGWFKKEQIFIKGNKLEGKRPHLSNQYSYIPLHIMGEIIIKKSSDFDFTNLLIDYAFYENSEVNKIVGNVRFMEKVKTILRKQTFEGGAPLKFKEYEVYELPFTGTDKNNAVQMEQWKNQQKKGQEELNAKIDKENKIIKDLRNHYLHWNSTFSFSTRDNPNILSRIPYNDPKLSDRKRNTR